VLDADQHPPPATDAPSVVAEDPHVGLALRRRRRSTERALVAAIAGVVVIAVVAFWAGTHVRRTVAPPPAHIAQPPPTARVAHGRLVETLHGTGRIARGPERTVRPLPVGADAGQPIVTRLPVGAGDRLAAGTVLGEVAGRPVVALDGAIPMYRDLKTGDVGADIAQLQSALARLGFGSADRPGTFGPGTGAAVEAFFRSRGYRAAGFLEPAVRPASHGRHARAPSVTLPGASVVYLRTLPATVSRVNSHVGARLDGALLRVVAGAPTIRVPLDPSQAIDVHPGLSARVTVGGRARTARVVAVRDSRGGNSTTVVLTLNHQSTRPRVGASVPATIVVRGTRRAVWSVPFSAVLTGADGTTFMRVAAGGGRWRSVPVALGISANGYVVVRPRGGRALRAGDVVAVGR
jgi:peptidoglycan hydrolase-like protein with peptidoglycan-binding domain